MRVAYVCADPGLPVFGRKGGSVHVQEVVRALGRQGHHVELFATRLGGPAPVGLGNVTVHPLPEIGRGPAGEREARGRAANAGLTAALDAASRRPFDVVYERYSLWSRAGMEWAARHGAAGIVEVNAPLIDEQATHRVLVDRPEAEQTSQAVFDAASAVVAVSEPVAAWARVRTAEPSRVHVVPNGVDPQRITPAPPGPLADTFTVGFVGTLKPWHGLEVLVDAVALLIGADPTYRLLVVGDGPGADPLAERVEALGITSTTTLAGAVDPDDVPGYLHRMDVAVAPYPALAGFYFSPLKLYEYLAAGLPVVASRQGQVTEVLDHGRTGLLVPPGQSVALAAAVASLRRDPCLGQALGRAGRELVVAGHSWDQVVARILALTQVGAEAVALTSAGAVA